MNSASGLFRVSQTRARKPGRAEWHAFRQRLGDLPTRDSLDCAGCGMPQAPCRPPEARPVGHCGLLARGGFRSVRAAARKAEIARVRTPLQDRWLKSRRIDEGVTEALYPFDTGFQVTD